jgi:type IV pilus assembly protein PilQ
MGLNRPTKTLIRCTVVFLVLSFAASIAMAQTKIPRQVEIEAIIFEVGNSDTLNLGINWTYSASGSHPNQAINSAEGFFDIEQYNNGILIDGGLASVSAGSSSFGTLDAVVQALMQSGQVKLISRPRIVVIEGKQATLTTGDSVPVKQSKVVGTTEIFTTSFKDSGVNLTVTPTILADDYIQMKISQEVSQVTQFIKIDEDDVPVFSKRSAKTEVVVANGDMIAIGGMIQNQQKKTVLKIPFLGDIPLLGQIFRSTKTVDFQAELYIFIKPQIVDPNTRFYLPPEAIEALGEVIDN